MKSRKLAKLGGFIGRKSDGDRGIETLWRGWMELSAAVMWEASQRASSESGLRQM